MRTFFFQKAAANPLGELGRERPLALKPYPSNVRSFKSQDISVDISAMLTPVDLKRKTILAFTGVNLAVNVALCPQHRSVVEKMQFLDPPVSR